MSKQLLPKDYKLLDSGNLKKLEQLGDKIIVRPSKTAVWKPKTIWNNIDAEYIPNSGWKFEKKQFESWAINLSNNLKLNLTLQNNGQIGLFPEHYTYFSKLESEIKRLEKRLGHKPRVLNMFAYTGMATCFCASMGAEVTHLEIAKKCVSWAKQNISLNKLENAKIRTIQDDALYFLQKEAKKNHLYDIVISDPPNFSRISKNKDWSLEDILPKLVSDIATVCNPKGYSVFFTSHMSQTSPQVFSNLFSDVFKSDIAYNNSYLTITEETGREMPFGHITNICK